MAKTISNLRQKRVEGKIYQTLRSKLLQNILSIESILSIENYIFAATQRNGEIKPAFNKSLRNIINKHTLETRWNKPK